MNFAPYSRIFVAATLVFTHLASFTFAAQNWDRLNPPKFKHITKSDGLSSGLITSIIQDHKGFMWFGTWRGLNRFDGNEFKVYNHDPTDSSSIPSNIVQSIIELKDSSLWIGTDNGILAKFDRGTNTFDCYQIQNSDSEQYQIKKIFEHSNGTIWLGTTNGLFLFDRENRMSSEVLFTKGKEAGLESVLDIVEDDKGNLFIGTNYRSGGLFYLDLTNNINYHFTVPRQIKEYPDSYRVHSLRFVKDGRLLIGATNGIYEFALPEFYTSIEQKQLPEFCSFDQFTSKIFNGRSIETFEIDSASNFWVGSYGTNGVHFYDIQSDSGTFFDIQANLKEKYKSIIVKSILFDKSGVVWLGTNGGSIFQYAPSAQKFGIINQNSKGNFKINSKSIRVVYQDLKQRLWIGGYGGLNIINRNKGNSRYLKDLRSTSLDEFSHVCFVYEDLYEGEDTYWIGTEGQGLFKYDYAANSIARYYTNSVLDSNLYFNYTMLRDRDGDLWVGTDVSLEVFNNELQKFQSVSLPESLCSDGNIEVSKIIEPGLAGNELWIATFRCGLIVFNKTNNKFRKYEPDIEDSLSIVGQNLNTIFQDSQQRIWIGSTQGLSLVINKVLKENVSFRQKEIIFKNYTTRDGLPHNDVRVILEDNQGIIWIGNHGVLSRFDPETNEFRNFDASDGLQGSDFMPNAAFKSSDGTLYFGGGSGVNYFNPSRLNFNSTIPEIVLTEFEILNRHYPLLDENGTEMDINEIGSITIDHDQNVISLSFSALDFSEPSKNQYAYRMEGFNEDWIDNGNNREVIYTNLDPGTYTFRVKASNNDGVWNEEGKSIELIILPPWWRTNWAYTLWLALFGVIIFYFNRFQINRIKTREQLKLEHEQVVKLQELDHLKSEFFANISHEFRTPLTLILNPIKSVLQKRKYKEIEKDLSLVERNASKLLNMVNQLLDLSKLEAGKMDASIKLGDMMKTINYLVASFESLAISRKISFSHKLAVARLTTEYNADHIEKILSNVFSNAFKFTEQHGKIAFFLDVLDRNKHVLSGDAISVSSVNYMQLIVRDSGIGIQQAKLPHIFDRFYQAESSTTTKHEGTGIGLALVKDLVELHKGTIGVKSEPGWGTEVTIVLPLEHVYEVSSPETSIAVSEVSGAELPMDVAGYAEASDKVEILDDKHVVQVVEDNKDLREHIRSILENKYRIVEAKDGEEGLSTAIEQIPDLIISDLMMPRMDGIELTNKLKEDQRTSHIPVILLTAKSSQEDKLAGLKIGADEFLAKPFNQEELKIRIENLIKIRSRLQQQYSSGLSQSVAAKPGREEVFLKRATEVVIDNIENDQFSVEDLSGELGMSRVQFHRKIKALTDQSTTTFIRNIRLERAKQLLVKGDYNVTEVAYMVGFSSQSYFTKSFQKHFGNAPSTYQT